MGGLNGVYGMRCDYDLGKMWWCVVVWVGVRVEIIRRGWVVGKLWFLVRGGLWLGDDFMVFVLGWWLCCFGWIGLVWGGLWGCCDYGLTRSYWGSNGLLIWCCVVRVELVCWGLIWFQCHWWSWGWWCWVRSVGCVVGFILWWLVCRGDVGWWSWCCDSRDCGGHGIELKLAWCKCDWVLGDYGG